MRLLVGQIRGKTIKTEKKKLGESKRETSKVKEGRKIESEREKYEERKNIEGKRKETHKNNKNEKMDRTGKGINGGDENDVVNGKQTNKRSIMDSNSGKDSLENFVVRNATKCAREKRKVEIEPCDLKRKDRKTDKWLSAGLKVDRGINRRNAKNDKKSNESMFKSYRKIHTYRHINAQGNRQKERHDSKKKDRHTHKKGVVNAESWPTATTKKETKRNTCKMNHVSSTAKEEEIFIRKIW